MPYLTQPAGQNTCAVVSICNYTGKSETDVYSAALFANITPRRIRERGTPDYAITLILLKLTGKPWRIIKSPKRNQSKLSGLAWVYNSTCHHLVPIINGMVFETTGATYSLEEYRNRGWHVKQVWSE